MQWDVGSAQQIPSEHVLNTTHLVDKLIHDNAAGAQVTGNMSSTQTQCVPTNGSTGLCSLLTNAH